MFAKWGSSEFMNVAVDTWTIPLQPNYTFQISDSALTVDTHAEWSDVKWQSIVKMLEMLTAVVWNPASSRFRPDGASFNKRLKRSRSLINGFVNRDSAVLLQSHVSLLLPERVTSYHLFFLQKEYISSNHRKTNQQMKRVFAWLFDVNFFGLNKWPRCLHSMDTMLLKIVIKLVSADRGFYIRLFLF